MTKRCFGLSVVFLLLGASCLLPATKKKHAAPSPARAAVPINPGSTFLAPSFRPSTLEEIAAALGSQQRGEFETSEEFAKRTRVDQAPFYCVAPGDISLSYSPDHQRYQALVFFQKLPPDLALRLFDLGSPQPDVIAVHSAGTSAGTYVGSNAYGVRKEVTRRRERETALFVAAPRAQEGLGEVTISVPIARARKVKPSALLVFQPITSRLGPVFEGTAYQTPTLDDPSEVVKSVRYVAAGRSELWIYDKETGEILGKAVLSRSPFPIFPGATEVMPEHYDSVHSKSEMTLWSDAPPAKVRSFYENALAADGPVKVEVVGDMVRLSASGVLVTAQVLGGHTVIGVEDRP